MKSRNMLPALCLALLSLPFTTHAVIIYDADASSTFTLIDSGGMSITAEPGFEPPSTTTTGSGAASVDADSQTGAGPGSTPFSVLGLESDLSGSAGDSPGTSEATVMNGFLLTLVNSTGGEATAVFEFSYTWFLEIEKDSAGNAPFEGAFASVFFGLSGFAPSGEETLAVDSGGGAVGVPDWIVNPILEIDFSVPGPDSFFVSDTATVTAYVTVPDGRTDQFSVLTDAIGAAVVVSEAPAMLTWMTGLIGLILLRRRPES